MRYALLIHVDENLYGQEGNDALLSTYGAFNERYKEQILGGGALQETATATTVRVRNGRMSVTDGPFAETKEQLAGIISSSATIWTRPSRSPPTSRMRCAAPSRCAQSRSPSRRSGPGRRAGAPRALDTAEWRDRALLGRRLDIYRLVTAVRAPVLSISVPAGRLPDDNRAVSLLQSLRRIKEDSDMTEALPLTTFYSGWSGYQRSPVV